MSNHLLITSIQLSLLYKDLLFCIIQGTMAKTKSFYVSSAIFSIYAWLNLQIWNLHMCSLIVYQHIISTRDVGEKKKQTNKQISVQLHKNRCPTFFRSKEFQVLPQRSQFISLPCPDHVSCPYYGSIMGTLRLQLISSSSTPWTKLV